MLQPTHREIQLYGDAAAGRVALIDEIDFELISRFRWNIREAKRAGRSDGPYAIASLRRADGGWTTTPMHKVITGWPRTDHINHNGLDNRRSNLRPATSSQNAANQRPQAVGRSSPYKGVYWRARERKWEAGIQVAGKGRYLGQFTSEIDAARAYDAAAQEAWGSYACLNFPESA